MRHGLVFFLLSLALFAVPQGSSKAGDFPVTTTAAQTRLMLELRAQQFLNRATFGATDATINALANDMQAKGINRACTDWIDAQFALAPTLHIPTINSMMIADGFTRTDANGNTVADTSAQVGGITRYRSHAWWHNSIAAPDQLKQRLAWALLQICVVSAPGINDSNFNPVIADLGTSPYQQPAYWLGLSSYYDMLLTRLNTNYRDVLQGVTTHPQMGLMLSSLGNQRENTVTGTVPDENYAREIMQLFTIGLYELNLDGSHKLNAGQSIETYENDTIQEFARAFTGMGFASNTSLTSVTGGFRDYVNTMRIVSAAHDTGSKRLLNGQTIPGNADAAAGIRAAVDNCFAHPNVAPFISNLLIQRFVMSNPSKGYIARVARVFNNNGAGVKGDMRAVMKAILTDSDAWASIQMSRQNAPLRLSVTTAGTEYCRLVEPVVQYASFMRRYGVPATTAPTNGRFMLPLAPGTWGQAPFQAPSVFNFYLPNHQPSASTNASVAGLPTTPGSTNIPERGPPGAASRDLFSPEFQIVDAVVANAWHNRTRADLTSNSSNPRRYTTTLTNPAGVNQTAIINFPMPTEVGLAASNDPAALIRHLDRVLCNGTMTESFKTNLRTAIQAEVNGTTSANQIDRLNGAMMTVMNSPFYLIRF
jgi:uncharacterized protein (DUF1800 family)